MTHVLLVLIARRETVQTKELRRLFGKNVYAYLDRLRESGVITVHDDVVTLNSSFRDLINLYMRELDTHINH